MKKLHVWWEDLDNVICCPNCGNQINLFYRGYEEPERFEPNFCPDCGQALDWSKTVPYGLKEEHETN